MSDNGSKNRKVPFSRTAAADWRVVASKHKLTATTNFPKFEWFVYMAAMFEHGNASWNFGSFSRRRKANWAPFFSSGSLSQTLSFFSIAKDRYQFSFYFGPTVLTPRSTMKLKHSYETCTHVCVEF